METSFFEEKNFCDFAFPLGYVKIFWTWILFKVGTFYVHHYQVKLGNAELPKNWGTMSKGEIKIQASQKTFFLWIYVVEKRKQLLGHDLQLQLRNKSKS